MSASSMALFYKTQRGLKGTIFRGLPFRQICSFPPLAGEEGTCRCCFSSKSWQQLFSLFQRLTDFYQFHGDRSNHWWCTQSLPILCMLLAAMPSSDDQENGSADITC
jgi:hypothetical protein